MIENRITQKIREASRAIITGIPDVGKQSVRKLAERIGRSKSSAHRHLKAIDKRDQNPESSQWETETGSVWLRLMFLSTLYQFGLKSGVGADSLSEFFTLVRVDTHIGVSPSAIRTQLNELERLLPEFQAECEKQISHQSREVVAGMDETFFGQFIILVLMDLRSGYLLLEDITEDRCFDTWHKKATPRLEQLGIKVTHAISDRAKALVKMAVTGFNCESGADTFHAQQDMSRALGGRIGKRVATASKQLEVAQRSENKAIHKKFSGFKLFNRKVTRMSAQKKLDQAKQAQTDYHDNLQGIAEEVHPFSLIDSQINDAEKVEERLEERAQAFEQIAKDQGINVSKKVMKKFRNQFSPLATSVTFWWFWVRETLQSLVIGKELEAWLTTTLLPVIYWHHKMQHTKKPKTKEKYRQAWEQASDTFKADPFSAKLPESEMQRWLVWADNTVRQFHRSSSAVEGRNGCLSQMYHNGRGLTPKRLKALTVIHNYGIKRVDGTTAAIRLFETDFPDLFSWLLDEMGELPLPRKGRERKISKPLKLIAVPS